MYDVVRVLLVHAAQVLQYADLLLRLAMEALLVAHDLERHVLAELVVVALEHLAEAALAKYFEHLEAVEDVIVLDGLVAAALVVVAVVVGAADHAADLLGILPDEVDLRVVEDLVLLERRQLRHVVAHHRLRRHRVHRATRRRRVESLLLLLLGGQELLRL